tara:strand:- start:27 stop:239 length:213 start_codon:yes stop_codon:yes gene_type:complete
MPYADPERQREATRAWKEAHPERVKEYRKKSMMKKVVQKGRIPRLSSLCDHHGLSDHEVLTLVKQVLAAR